MLQIKTQRSTVRMCYRADGKIGGWKWREYPCTVYAVRRKTAVIIRDGWGDAEVVALDRLTPRPMP